MLINARNSCNARKLDSRGGIILNKCYNTVTGIDPHSTRRACTLNARILSADGGGTFDQVCGRCRRVLA